MKYRIKITSLILFSGLATSMACLGQSDEQDPAEIAIGERLFLETRFAQAYYANPGKADPALEYTLTMDQPLRGPFAGKTMNCRACHMVDDHLNDHAAGMRSYADFTHNSLIPDRKDGKHTTPRNSMSLVNISAASRHGNLFHFDGEFNSMQDLVRATLTGRNYGWLATESDQAIKHVANIIRLDDGKDELGKEFGGSYKNILAGIDKSIPAEFRLPSQYQLDVNKASDKEIFNAVAELISAYVNDLNYSQDEKGNYNGTPYDQFLKINKLPQQPEKGESPQAYADRLLAAVNKLKNPKFVTGKNTKYKYHQQPFAFREQELAGMKLFFARGDQQTRGGNCVSCHAAPHFSDYSFHNTGLSQHNYDRTHGEGAFAKLNIPDLSQRNQQYDQYLPATAKHPHASGRYRTPIDLDKPGYVDLGLWNVFANPDIPAPQTKLNNILCEQAGKTACKANELLPLTIAAFKTPVLRDLGHSNPYFHTGEFNTLQEAVTFYITSSALAKNNTLTNSDKELRNINISNDDVPALVAFLQSLNEDYD